MCETEYEYSYVNPMYDMTPMQYMGNMSNQYMTMETPYIMPFDDGDSMNDCGITTNMIFKNDTINE